MGGGAQVPVELQPRALNWGILSAIAMRGVMIFSVGVAALKWLR
jgi:predicted tellurium resistance membrane protein TerC